jgi:hypothetical protein
MSPKKRGQYIGSSGLQGWVDLSGVWEKTVRKRVKGQSRPGTKDKKTKLMYAMVKEAQDRFMLKEALKEPTPTEGLPSGKIDIPSFGLNKEKG